MAWLRFYFLRRQAGLSGVLAAGRVKRTTAVARDCRMSVVPPQVRPSRPRSYLDLVAIEAKPSTSNRRILLLVLQAFVFEGSPLTAADLSSFLNFAQLKAFKKMPTPNLNKTRDDAPECQRCRPTTHLDLGRWRQGLHFSATFTTEHYVIRERNQGPEKLYGSDDKDQIQAHTL